MPKFAQKVTIDMQRKMLLINGEEFPWFIAEDGIDVLDLLSPSDIPSFVLRIPAGTIEVIPEDKPSP